MASELKLDFVTLDVFTSTRFLGNPLAVVFVPSDQRHLLTQATKQRIAREFNLSETVFLHTLPSEPNLSDSTREIDIFLTTSEIPFAGHPTIGTAYLIFHHLGWTHITTLLTKAGPIPITLVPDGGGVSAVVPQAVHTHRHTLETFTVSPSIPSQVKDAITAGLLPDPETRNAELAAPIVDIVKGMAFALVRLPSLHHLSKVKATGLELGRVPGLLDWEGEESFAARYYFVVVGEEMTEGRVCEVRTRNVELGFEDPATGSAACALAGWLALDSSPERVAGDGEGRARFRVVQGVEMGRRSEIDVEVVVGEEGGKKVVREVKLGGKAVVVMNGSVVV